MTRPVAGGLRCGHPGRRRARALAAAAAVVAFTPGFTPAFAAGERAGDAVVVAHAGSSRGIAGGGSTTPFSLRLPRGAACPGDSANDGYRVQGFIVPATDDPATLRYKSIKPDGDGRWGLFDETTRSYAQEQTANRAAPGQPGPIVNIPTFSFAVFPPGTLRPGRYRIGVACTLIKKTVRHWDSELALVRAPADKPGELRWAVIGFTGHRARTTSTAAAVALVVAVTSGGTLLARRRRSSRPVAALVRGR